MNMFATSNSAARGVRCALRFAVTLLVCSGFNLLLTHADTADLKPADRARFTARAKEIFAEAEKLHAASPTNTDAAWKFSRAAFDRADYSTNDAERAAIAVQGIDACRKVLVRDSKSAPAHYYLGMDLGQ